MHCLIILLLCSLATGKMVLQTSFGRGQMKCFSDTAFYNALVFSVSSLLFVGQIPKTSPGLWAYGALFGVLSVVYQLCYTKALSMGNVSLTVMIINLHMIVPIVLSLVVYREPLTLFRVLGMILCVAAFSVSVKFEKKTSYKQWILLTLTSFLSTGCTAVIQKVFGKSQYASNPQAFVFCSYVVAALVTWIIYLIFARTQIAETSKHRRVYLYAGIIGVILAVFQAVNTYVVANIDGTFFYPTYAGGTVVMSSLAGVLLFKDKLSLKQTVSLVLGVSAVVLMNF